jgi:hypothetical protein
MDTHQMEAAFDLALEMARHTPKGSVQVHLLFLRDQFQLLQCQPAKSTAAITI